MHTRSHPILFSPAGGIVKNRSIGLDVSDFTGQWEFGVKVTNHEFIRGTTTINKSTRDAKLRRRRAKPRVKSGVAKVHQQ